MKNIVLVLALLFSNIKAQNLILNPSFEYYVQCPTYYNYSPVTITPEWNSLGSIGAADFNECFTIIGPAPYYNNFDVPTNIVGYQNTKNGSGYAGFFTFMDTTYAFGGSTYMYQVLNDTLKPNKKYHVGYYISLSDDSKYTTSAMGMHFSSNYNNFINSFDTVPPGFHLPIQMVNTTQQLTDKTKWYKLEWDYTAIGTECIILIGNKRNGIVFQECAFFCQCGIIIITRFK